jgi:hypothetical protein
MAKIKFVQFILILAAALIFPLQAMASTLTLGPATGTVTPGCTFTVTIQLDTQGKQTDGTDAILMYNTAVFSIPESTRVINGTIYPDYPGNVIENSAGKVTISGLASVSQPFNGQGVFATINFHVLPTAAAGPATITFDFDPNDKGKTTDSNVVERGTVVDTLNSVVNGNYTVGPNAGCGAATKPIGAPGSGTGSSVPVSSGSAIATPPPQLSNTALTGTTWVLAIAGTALTVIGIIGLALM